MILFKNKGKEKHISIKRKLVYALSVIAALLLLTSVISILEYRRMSNYVSDLIAKNIHNMNVSQKLLSNTDRYNLDILAMIGTSDISVLEEFNQDRYIKENQDICADYSSENVEYLDGILNSYSAYMTKSKELEKAMMSDFIDAREWFFIELQPLFNTFRANVELFNYHVYKNLKENSINFQAGFYRSIIPSAVSVVAGILLVILLLFFIIVYYLNPLKIMLRKMSEYLLTGKRYIYEFDGDDELSELNQSISEIVEENIELKKRIKILREDKL